MQNQRRLQQVPVPPSLSSVCFPFIALCHILVAMLIWCSLIQYTKATKDYMVPSVWGPVDKKDDPYAPTTQGGCCVVM